jgi:ComF family protein
MLLDLLFPVRSLEGAEGTWVTPSEFARLRSHLRIFEAAELRRMGLHSLDRVSAASTYRDVPLLRKAIHTFKYRRIPGLGETLQRVLEDGLANTSPFRSDACITPVPLHFTRRFRRGFNQADILAEALAKKTSLPILPLLTRIRPTGFQAKRKRAARFTAVKWAFRPSICPSVSATRDDTKLPYCVYLVDDLMTTGATLDACARVLKEAGVKRVEGIVLAHG